MFKYLKHKEIDLDLWDNCIEVSNNGSIYALSWFLNIACESWDAIIKKEDSRYVYVFPLPIKKRFGFDILYNPVFCHQLGLISVRPTTPSDFKIIYNMLREKFKYISNYHFNIYNSAQLGYKFFDFESHIHTSFQIDLSISYDHIYNNLSKDRKINIERSRRYNLRVEEFPALDAIIELFKKETAYKIYGGVKEYQYQIARKIYRASIDRNSSSTFAIKNENNQIIYGCWFLIYKNKLIKFFNASNEEGRRKNCDSLFMDHIFRIYANSNFILDFERESSEGVNKYKESYSPQKAYYLEVKSNNLPFYLNKIQEFRKQVVRLLKGVV